MKKNERNAGAKPKYAPDVETDFVRINIKVPKEQKQKITIACKVLINEILKQ